MLGASFSHPYGLTLPTQMQCLPLSKAVLKQRNAANEVEFLVDTGHM